MHPFRIGQIVPAVVQITNSLQTLFGLVPGKYSFFIYLFIFEIKGFNYLNYLKLLSISFYRASSLNSVYSENSNTTNTSEPLQWLSLTLTKRELDKICKDNHHKVYTSDFKVFKNKTIGIDLQVIQTFSLF